MLPTEPVTKQILFLPYSASHHSLLTPAPLAISAPCLTNAAEDGEGVALLSDLALAPLPLAKVLPSEVLGPCLPFHVFDLLTLVSLPAAPAALPGFTFAVVEEATTAADFPGICQGGRASSARTRWLTLLVRWRPPPLFPPTGLSLGSTAAFRPDPVPAVPGRDAACGRERSEGLLEIVLDEGELKAARPAEKAR